jgi:hypothetical protein
MTGAHAIDMEFGFKLGFDGFEEVTVIAFERP